MVDWLLRGDVVRARVQDNDYGNRVDLLFEVRHDNGRRSVGTHVVFAPAAEDIPIPPTLAIPRPAAQMLMDELWRCGLRPTEARGGDQAFEAQRRHLEDMRVIVFGKAGVP